MDEPLIVLGVTGGIAAYKAAALCSKLVQSGFPVQVVMTENACRFVTPLTFRTLSRREVLTELWNERTWQPRHVELAQEAKLFVAAPADANFIAKLAHGIADDALSTFSAAWNGPVLLAPAMNPGMWSHAACQENCATLRQRGVRFIGPCEGHVACGADGSGRMAEVEEILAAIRAAF